MFVGFNPLQQQQIPRFGGAGFGSFGSPMGSGFGSFGGSSFGSPMGSGFGSFGGSSFGNPVGPGFGSFGGSALGSPLGGGIPNINFNVGIDPSAMFGSQLSGFSDPFAMFGGFNPGNALTTFALGEEGGDFGGGRPRRPDDVVTTLALGEEGGDWGRHKPRCNDHDDPFHFPPGDPYRPPIQRPRPPRPDNGGGFDRQLFSLFNSFLDLFSRFFENMGGPRRRSI